jgi:amidase
MTSTSILDLFLVLNLLISASTSLKLDYSINSVHSLLRSRKSNCTDIISHFIQRSAIYCPQIVLNPFSLAEARQLDLARHSCQLNGRLECIPMIVRDSIDVVGMATTGGLSSLRNSYPEQDAELIARMRSEGAIVVAKSSDLITNNSCVNPFDKEASYFHESNAPIATSIAVGAAIIGIGFDSDGLAQVSSSLNHVNSIR